jgi:hypothetical protein
MTTVDVVYRYATHPTELEMMALGKAREVYGIRRVAVDRQERTIRVEYDATRLTRPEVSKILRRAGMSITDEVSLIPPRPVAPLADEKRDLAPAK